MDYQKPEVIDYGDLVELTAGSTFGNSFDGNYTVGQEGRIDILTCKPGGIPCFNIGVTP